MAFALRLVPNDEVEQAGSVSSWLSLRLRRGRNGPLKLGARIRSSIAATAIYRFSPGVPL